MDAPADPSGRWHAKDHLAHLTWWRWQSARAIEAARTGATLPALPDDDSIQNASVYEETKDLPVAELRKDSARSWSALEAAIKASTEEDLSRPHPRYPDNQAWEAVPGMGGHVGVHLMFWFMENGDVRRAEAAAKWGYDFECGLFPEGPKRAEAAYNLACFYARAGRVDEALPLLRASLPVNPELARWAREDSDLEGIRDDPRVRELLGET